MKYETIISNSVAILRVNKHLTDIITYTKLSKEISCVRQVKSLERYGWYNRERDTYSNWVTYLSHKVTSTGMSCIHIQVCHTIDAHNSPG